jgi:hypothetical protein
MLPTCDTVREWQEKVKSRTVTKLGELGKGAAIPTRKK